MNPKTWHWMMVWAGLGLILSALIVSATQGILFSIAGTSFWAINAPVALLIVCMIFVGWLLLWLANNNKWRPW